MKAILQRLETDDFGTFGVLRVNDFTWMSGELPWRYNKVGKSCIPAGVYKVAWGKSPHLSKRAGADVFKYRIEPVPGRSGVLMHRANFMGDEDLGHKAQVDGCIALGKRIDVLQGQKALLLSGTAMDEFERYMRHEPFTLEVLDIPADYSKVGT